MIIFLSLLSAGLVIAVDQITKFLIFSKVSGSIIGNLLWFESYYNTGMAFSMFENSQIALIIITALASVLLLVVICIKSYFNSKAEKILLGVVLGGALSNLIDRLAFGAVRDFISLKFMNFAIFNVADMVVTIGIIAFAIVYLIKSIKKEKKKDVGTES